eukprot:3567273-Prorocentrum_lima.AAC.1
MTSSLVGSEMCIRDSFYAAPALGAQFLQIAALVCRQMACGTWCPSSPVSYTHLTLPTICSV